MNSLAVEFVPPITRVEALSSSCKNSHRGRVEASATNRKLRLIRENVSKTQCWRFRGLPAGERARPRAARVRCGLLLDPGADLREQAAAAAAEQVGSSSDARDQWLSCVEGQGTESTDELGRFLTRRFLLALPVAAASLPSPSFAAVKVENRAPSGNPLLRSFGVGDPDIYYPRFFEGTWTCYSTLIAVETPRGEDKVDVKSVEQSRKRLGYTTTYQARFVPFEGYVVCDRLFTTVSLVESIIGKNTVEHGTWNPRQPNRLELILKGGAKVENTVTKRSAGMFSAYEFESAEFSKQVLDNFSIKDGPPTVKASQNLMRYQWNIAADEVSKIEAIQKVSMYAVPKEGENFEVLEIFNSNSPITIYKYRITFERQAPNVGLD